MVLSKLWQWFFGPKLGDIRLISQGQHGVEVWVEVNGIWRVAIKEHHDCSGCLISHFVCVDGNKPLKWPEANHGAV